MPRKHLRAQVLSTGLSSLKSSKLLQFALLSVIALMCYHRNGALMFSLPPLAMLLIFYSALALEFKLLVWFVMTTLGLGKSITNVTSNLILGDIILSEDQIYNIRKKYHLSAIVSIVSKESRQINTMFGKFFNLKEARNNKDDSDDLEHIVLEASRLDSMTEYELKEACNVINRFTSQGKNIYFHCLNGNGNSACAVLAYLVKFERQSIDTAYEKLYKCRSTIFSKQSKYYKLVESFQKSVS